MFSLLYQWLHYYSFKKNGFLVLRNIYDVKQHTSTRKNLYTYIQSLPFQKPDQQSPNTPAYYNNPELCKVQMHLLHKVEKIIGAKLFPTHTYLRIYNKDSKLTPHTDRSACEFVLSLTIGIEGDYVWPICIQNKSGVNKSVTLYPGDGLLFKGIDLVHWRESAPKKFNTQAQAFIHYVKQDGEYEDQIFDLPNLKQKRKRTKLTQSNHQ